ncbi:hypothetical protein V5O48_001789 [Marasmius crinis-equi]|uniref:Uncharacterized protein n=1 Tax=Marasmius crinis-equi TaxID=585013 RepID=A0ABR3FXD0_9AGAR
MEDIPPATAKLSETISQSPHLPSPTQPSPRPSTPREPRQREPVTTTTGTGSEPPRQPRMHRGRGDFRGMGVGRGGPFRGTGAEPPRGPRNRGPPSTMVSTATPPINTGVNSQSPASASQNPQNGTASAPSTPSQPALIPAHVVDIEIPTYEELFPSNAATERLKALQAMLDNHMKDYTNSQRECKAVARSTQRAIHDFELSTIDLKAAEARRKGTAVQLDMAKNGVLGIDYVPREQDKILL